jgi:hypothetical protein
MSGPDEYGAIVDVSTVNNGDQLVAAAASGASTLALSDVTMFDELGGRLMLNGVIYDYIAVDTDLNTLTLFGTLSAAAAEDDRVEIYPPAPVRTAMVDFGIEESEAVPAVIPSGLSVSLADGLRDESTRENVLVEERGNGELYVKDVMAQQMDTGWVRTIADVCVPGTDWSVTEAYARRVDRVVSVYLVATRTNSALTVPAGGDIANTIVATMVAAFRTGEDSPNQGGLSTGSSGRGVFGYIRGNGEILLNAVVPGTNLTVGEQITVGGTYLL